MLPALRHRLISRLSPFHVIPPIGEPILNFQNHNDKVWAILQNIKEREKAVSQEMAPALLSKKEELSSSLGDQHSNLEQIKSIDNEEMNETTEREEKMDEECAENAWQRQTSSSDSEVEFSINLGPHLVLRYSPSDEELSSDSEFVSVLGNSTFISPEDAFSGEIQELEGMPVKERDTGRMNIPR